MIIFFETTGLVSFSGVQRGGCGRCDGPGHPAWGASQGPVSVKKCR